MSPTRRDPRPPLVRYPRPAVNGVERAFGYTGRSPLVLFWFEAGRVHWYDGVRQGRSNATGAKLWTAARFNPERAAILRGIDAALGEELELGDAGTPRHIVLLERVGRNWLIGSFEEVWAWLTELVEAGFYDVARRRRGAERVAVLGAEEPTDEARVLEVLREQPVERQARTIAKLAGLDRDRTEEALSTLHDLFLAYRSKRGLWMAESVAFRRAMEGEKL